MQKVARIIAAIIILFGIISMGIRVYNAYSIKNCGNVSEHSHKQTFDFLDTRYELTVVDTVCED